MNISRLKRNVNASSIASDHSGGTGDFAASVGSWTARSTQLATMTTRVVPSNHHCSTTQMKTRRRLCAGASAQHDVPEYRRPDDPRMLTTCFLSLWERTISMPVGRLGSRPRAEPRRFS
jgi:hypothetical protein